MLTKQTFRALKEIAQQGTDKDVRTAFGLPHPGEAEEHILETLRVPERDLSVPSDYWGTAILAKTLLGPNIEGQTIVEIGPGGRGDYCLEYLRNLGVNAYGIDPRSYSYSDLVRRLTWQNLHSGETHSNNTHTPGFQEGSVDMVYVTYMQPIPEGYRELDRRRFGARLFDQQVCRETDKVLCPGGVFMIQNWNTDFRLRDDVFLSGGYERFELKLSEDGPARIGEAAIYWKPEVR